MHKMGASKHQPRASAFFTRTNITMLFGLLCALSLAKKGARAQDESAFSNRFEPAGFEWLRQDLGTPPERTVLDQYLFVNHTKRPLAYVSSCEQAHLRYTQQSLYTHLGYGLSSEPGKADLILRIYPYPCRKHGGQVQYWNTRFHYAYPQWFKSYEEAKSPLKRAPGIDLKQLMATRKHPQVKLPKREEGHAMLRTLHSKLHLCENAQEIAAKFAQWATTQNSKTLAVSSRTMVVGRGWIAPPCVSFPAQLDLGKAAMTNKDLLSDWPLWAHKTEGSYLGAGVLSISPLSEIVKAYEEKKAFYRPAAMIRPGQNKNTKLERSFASAYMMKPFLFKDKSGAVKNAVKTDFRTWALVAGTFPPRVYISRQGLFRAADPSASWDTKANLEQMMNSFKKHKAKHVTNAVETKNYLVTSLNGAFEAFANTGPLLPQYAEAMERDGINSNQSLHDARMASAYTYVNQFSKADCVTQKQLCNRHFVSGFADVGLSATGETFIFEMAMHTIYKNRPGDTYGKDVYMGGNLMQAFWATRAVAGGAHIGGGKLYRECQATLGLQQAAGGGRWSQAWLASVPSQLQLASSVLGESRADILSMMCAEKILAANFELEDMVSGARGSLPGEEQVPLWRRDEFLGSLLRDDHREMLEAFEDLLGKFVRNHALYVRVGGKTFT